MRARKKRPAESTSTDEISRELISRNNPVDHGNDVSADAAVKQQPVRLGQGVTGPSARLTEEPPDELRKARYLQQFGLSHVSASGRCHQSRL